MKIPRDIDASDIIRALRILGYESVRQGGSHIRLRCNHQRGNPSCDGSKSRATENRHPTRRGIEARNSSPQTDHQGIVRQIGFVNQQVTRELVKCGTRTIHSMLSTLHHCEAAPENRASG
jgi:hypothetical protein